MRLSKRTLRGSSDVLVGGARGDMGNDRRGSGGGRLNRRERWLRGGKNWRLVSLLYQNSAVDEYKLQKKGFYAPNYKFAGQQFTISAHLVGG